MRRVLFLVVTFCAALLAQGAWYWPFGSKEDDPSKPLRLHRLLEEANNYIEIAEDEALSGNGDKALENYRLALSELDRVERENPDRAETSEFSPLRNKRAACVAAMDAIRFAQVNDNERAVSVTDTRELQKKWNKKHGIKEVQDEGEKVKDEKRPEAKKDIAKDDKVVKDIKDTKADKTVEEAKDKVVEKTRDDKVVEKTKDDKVVKDIKDTRDDKVIIKEKKDEKVIIKEAKDKIVRESKDDKVVEGTKVVKEIKEDKATKDETADFKFRLKTALAEVRNKDYVAADLLLEELMQEKPGDLNVLLLRAAAQTGMGSNYAARRTLEKAMRTHPKSYLPYYNLANLVLQMGESVEIARQYYEMGRMVGGPPSTALERLLKGEK